MVGFRIKVHPKQGQAYIPKEIVEALGYSLRAKADRYPAFLIRSLEIILNDLKLEGEAKP